MYDDQIKHGGSKATRSSTCHRTRVCNLVTSLRTFYRRPLTEEDTLYEEES